MKTILKALFLFVSLALAGSVFAQVDFESTKARAEAGDAVAQFNLGMMYADGTGVTQSEQEAVKWYQLAAEQGDADAQYKLGLEYLVGEKVIQNYEEAFYWFDLGAKQGDSGSQIEIAMMYERGRGVRQDFSQAYIWYSLANMTTPRGSENLFASGASNARNRMEEKLTPKELQEAQALATRCFESNYKDCGE